MQWQGSGSIVLGQDGHCEMLSAIGVASFHNRTCSVHTAIIKSEVNKRCTKYPERNLSSYM